MKNKEALRMVLKTLMLSTLMTIALAEEGISQSIQMSHLTWATSSYPEGPDALGARRTNPTAALGAPDVNIYTQSHLAQETRFFSLRRTPDYGASGTTFYFGPNRTDKILNRISRADENLPDFYAVEITWGTLWHLEGARVKLVNATVVDSQGNLQIYPEYDVGVIFSIAALATRNLNHPEVVKYRAQNSYESIGGQKNITAFKFPREVLEAEAVKLVDYTDELNKNQKGQYINTGTTYDRRYYPYPISSAANWDGSDIDALGVHTTPTYDCGAPEGFFATLARNKELCSFQPIPIHLRGDFDTSYGIQVKKGTWQITTGFYNTGLSCLYQGAFYPYMGHDGPGTYTFTARKADGTDYSFSANLTCDTPN